jgi:hypothetical protein
MCHRSLNESTFNRLTKRSSPFPGVELTSKKNLSQFFPQPVFFFVPLNIRQEAGVDVRIFSETFPLQLRPVVIVVIVIVVGRFDERRPGFWLF